MNSSSDEDFISTSYSRCGRKDRPYKPPNSKHRQKIEEPPRSSKRDKSIYSAVKHANRSMEEGVEDKENVKKQMNVSSSKGSKSKNDVRTEYDDQKKISSKLSKSSSKQNHKLDRTIEGSGKDHTITIGTLDQSKAASSRRGNLSSDSGSMRPGTDSTERDTSNETIRRRSPRLHDHIKRKEASSERTQRGEALVNVSARVAVPASHRMTIVSSKNKRVLSEIAEESERAAASNMVDRKGMWNSCFAHYSSIQEEEQLEFSLDDDWDDSRYIRLIDRRISKSRPHLLDDNASDPSDEGSEKLEEADDQDDFRRSLHEPSGKDLAKYTRSICTMKRADFNSARSSSRTLLRISGNISTEFQSGTFSNFQSKIELKVLDMKLQFSHSYLEMMKNLTGFDIRDCARTLTLCCNPQDLNRVIEERGRSLRQLDNSFRPLDCTTSAMNRSMRARNMMLGMLTPRRDPKKNPSNDTTLDLKLEDSPLSSSTPFLAGPKGLSRTNNSSRAMLYDPGAMTSSLTSECKEQFNLTLDESRICTPISSSTPFGTHSKGLSRTNNSSRVMKAEPGGMDSSLNMSLSSRRKEQFMLKMLTPQKSKQSSVDCTIPKISPRANSGSTLDLRVPIAGNVSSKLNTSVNISNRSLMFAKRFLCKKNQADIKPAAEPEPDSTGSSSAPLDKEQCSAPLPEKVADVTSKNPTCEDPVVVQVKKECRSRTPSPAPLPSRKRKKSSPPVKSEPPSAPMSRLGTAKELDIELKKLSASHPHLRDLINMSPMKQIFDLDDKHVMPSPSKRHRFEEKDFLSSTRICDITGSLQNLAGPSTASAHQVESSYPAQGSHHPTNMADTRSSPSTRYYPEEPPQICQHNDRQGSRPGDYHADGFGERGPYPPPHHSPHPNRPIPHEPPPHGLPPHGPPPNFHGPPPKHHHPSYSDYHRPNHEYYPPTKYHGYPGYNRYDRDYPHYEGYDLNGYRRHYQEHRGDPYGRSDYNNRHPHDRGYPAQVKIVNTFSPYHGQPLPATENGIVPNGSGENQQPNNIPTLGISRGTGQNSIDSLQAPLVNNIIEKLNEKGSKMRICLKYDLEVLDEDDQENKDKENTKKEKKK